MLDILKKIDIKKTGIFAAGVLFGTAGVKVLGSKDAKKVYTNCTAAALRAKDCVMKTATTIQENAEDIYAEAQQINEERAAKEEEIFEESEQEECAQEEECEQNECEEVKEEAKAGALQDKQYEAFGNHIETLKEKIKVEIFEDKLA